MAQQNRGWAQQLMNEMYKANDEIITFEYACKSAVYNMWD